MLVGLAPTSYPYIKYIMGRLARSRGDRIEKKKMGRPTDEPKTHMYKVRISDFDLQKLEESSKALGITKAAVIRKGIDEIYKQIKK